MTLLQQLYQEKFQNPQPEVLKPEQLPSVARLSEPLKTYLLGYYNNVYDNQFNQEALSHIDAVTQRLSRFPQLLEKVKPANDLILDIKVLARKLLIHNILHTKEVRELYLEAAERTDTPRPHDIAQEIVDAIGRPEGWGDVKLSIPQGAIDVTVGDQTLFISEYDLHFGNPKHPERLVPFDYAPDYASTLVKSIIAGLEIREKETLKRIEQFTDIHDDHLQTLTHIKGFLEALVEKQKPYMENVFAPMVKAPIQGLLTEIEEIDAYVESAIPEITEHRNFLTNSLSDGLPNNVDRGLRLATLEHFVNAKPNNLDELHIPSASRAYSITKRELTRVKNAVTRVKNMTFKRRQEFATIYKAWVDTTRELTQDREITHLTMLDGVNVEVGHQTLYLDGKVVTPFNLYPQVFDGVPFVAQFSHYYRTKHRDALADKQIQVAKQLLGLN